MRTALRASLATAALAGALLAPAAGAAHAATTVRQAAAVTSQSPADRFSGTPASIGGGLVAVLRHEAEGPEAWIRAVGPDWKPGDHYMFRVLTVLDRANTADTVNGLDLEITGVDSAAPVLTVTKAGATESFPLPLSEAARTHGARCVSATKRLGLHGTLVADLTTTPDGPQVQLVDGITKEPREKLTRTAPAPAKDDRTAARIVNASGARPSFTYATPGGESPFGTALFPELPAGCALTYPFEEEAAPAPKREATPAAQPAPSPSTGPAAPAAPKARTAVAPQGGVAAGAGEEAAEDAGAPVAASAGAGLAAVVAGLGAAFLARRRGRTQR
ncbi:hypothetical protein [Streptomyces sp. fd1-xmd]|uniref:hypothetical protein n=1 Tax=Streptomyces sp. fd1-xmd TaxID=1812480 RepID=UPI0009906B39|nr:hypothetical protein [Streptomyces sp. fd1-xmd]AQT74089.1 hypothetical protein B1K54_22750 [Streptomyces sp. fd1-xmd]